MKEGREAGREETTYSNRGGDEIQSIINTVNTTMSMHAVLDFSVVSRVGPTWIQGTQILYF